VKNAVKLEDSDGGEAFNVESKSRQAGWLEFEEYQDRKAVTVLFDVTSHGR